MKTTSGICASLAFRLAATILLFTTSGQAILAQNANDNVILDTSRGRIVLRIYRGVVPYTANNFLDLVNRQFYDGLTFHRIEDWVIQGGDPKGDGTGDFVDPATGRTRYLKLETTPRLTHNQPGMVAMARSSNPNSASCQFYIIKRAMPQLNGQYAVFGRVIQGMNAVYAMRAGDQIIHAYQDGGGLSATQEAVPGVPNPPEPPLPRGPRLPPGETGF